MPDKWEYSWYAVWDLAFHTLALSLVDFDFAKEQLLLMLRNLYARPNGQIPAYEWNFSDVNPPVHAWATLFLYNIEKELGRSDLRFLERSFQGLMLNFNWWSNRKDHQYLPMESNTGIGGNSNWRFPVWMPANGLLIRGLLNLYQSYGDDFKVECPTGSGKYMTLLEWRKRSLGDYLVSFSGIRTESALFMVAPESFRKILIGEIISSSMSIFMATTVPASALATK